jgi:hypothetical protein
MNNIARHSLQLLAIHVSVPHERYFLRKSPRSLGFNPKLILWSKCMTNEHASLAVMDGSVCRDVAMARVSP